MVPELGYEKRKKSALKTKDDQFLLELAKNIATPKMKDHPAFDFQNNSQLIAEELKLIIKEAKSKNMFRRAKSQEKMCIHESKNENQTLKEEEKKEEINFI